MPLAKSHSLPNKKDRKPKPYKTSRGIAVKNKEYYEAEEVLDQLYCDICNGVSKSDCMQKLIGGVYGKELKPRNANDYYNAALERLQYNADIEAKQLRDLLYNRYETVLEECMKRNDLFNARATLDSIAKIFLGIRDNQTNIQLNSDNDGGITINFGFSPKSDEDEQVKNVIDADFEEAQR